MRNVYLLVIAVFGFGMLQTGCASDNQSRYPASRAGRPYKESRPMNHRSLDTDSLYQACLRERPELSCRNRMGR